LLEAARLPMPIELILSNKKIRRRKREI